MRKQHALYLGAALLSWTSLVYGHRFEHPRQIRLGMKRDRVVVSMIYDLNPGEPSRTARQLFDRNTDGVIDEGERALLESWMERTALRFFSVSLSRPDGASEQIGFETLRREGHRTTLPSSATETVGLSLLLSAPLPSGPGPFELRVEDYEADQRTHVPLVLDLEPGLSLDFSSQGEWHPATRQLQRVELSKDRPLRLRFSVSRGGP